MKKSLDQIIQNGKDLVKISIIAASIGSTLVLGGCAVKKPAFSEFLDKNSIAVETNFFTKSEVLTFNENFTDQDLFRSRFCEHGVRLKAYFDVVIAPSYIIDKVLNQDYEAFKIEKITFESYEVFEFEGNSYRCRFPLEVKRKIEALGFEDYLKRKVQHIPFGRITYTSPDEKQIKVVFDIDFHRLPESSTTKVIDNPIHMNKSCVSDEVLNYNLVDYVYKYFPEAQANELFAYWGKYVHTVDRVEDLNPGEDVSVTKEIEKLIEDYDNFQITDGKTFNCLISIIKPGFKVNGEYVQEPQIIKTKI